MSTVSLRERLGGCWAFSWQASIAGSVLITMLIVARGTSLGGTDSTLAVAIGWFVVALIAVAMKSGYQLIGEKTILRNRRILADQMEFLMAGVPAGSRLHLTPGSERAA